MSESLSQESISEERIYFGNRRQCPTVTVTGSEGITGTDVPSVLHCNVDLLLEERGTHLSEMEEEEERKVLEREKLTLPLHIGI